MYPLRKILFIALHALALCFAWNAHGKESTDPALKAFDRIVDKNLLAAGFENDALLSFKIIKQANARIYEGSYQFSRKKSAEHYLLSISVAKAGQFLDVPSYQMRLATAKQQVPERGEEYLAHEFPDIGMRAQRNFFGAGPGGAAHGLTFTTADGKFDVRIMVSSLLPEGIKDPNVGIDAMARKIAERYDGQLKK